MRSRLYIGHCSTLQLTTERKHNTFGLVWFRKIFQKPGTGVFAWSRIIDVVGDHRGCYRRTVRRRQNAAVADHIGVGKVGDHQVRGVDAENRLLGMRIVRC